jgi:hypothetical protein
VFYWLSGRDLKREAEALRNQTNLLMRAMEASHSAKFARDPEGNPKGLCHNKDAQNEVPFGNCADRTVDGDSVAERSC